MSLIHDSHLEDQKDVPSAPNVVLPLEGVCIQEGEPARFRCRIIGFPAPKISWFLNEQSIRPSKRQVNEFFVTTSNEPIVYCAIVVI